MTEREFAVEIANEILRSRPNSDHAILAREFLRALTEPRHQVAQTPGGRTVLELKDKN